jgi:O-antigen/teichoic acid export membrane protein
MHSPLADRTNQGSPPVGITPSTLLARNATLNFLTQGWIVVVLIVAMPRLVSYLGETAFGLFSLTWVMVGYLSFLDIGVNRAATKFVSEHLAERDHESAREIVRSAILANLAMGLAGGVAVVLAAPFLVHSVFRIAPELQHQAQLAFYVVGLAVPVLLAQGIFRAVLSSFQRFALIDMVEVLATTAQWGTAAVLAWQGHGIALVVLSAVLARVLAATLYGLAVWHLFPDLGLFRQSFLHGLPKLLRFGGWVTVSQVVSPLLVYLDRVFIASFVSLAAVTLYTVPFEAMTRLRIIPAALVGTLYPAFSERGGADQVEGLQRLYERSVRYLLLVLLSGTMFLFVLGPDLFRLWMGDAFAQNTTAMVRILVLGIFANALAPIPYNLLQALGRPDLTGKFHLAELPLYVGLCVLLIPRWGITGAALASTIRLALDSVLLFWAAGKYCHCSLRRFWWRSFPRIALVGSVLGLAMLAIRSAFDGPLVRLGLGLLALAIWLLAAWVFLVDREEKPRIQGVLRTLLGQVTS